MFVLSIFTALVGVVIGMVNANKKTLAKSFETSLEQIQTSVTEVKDSVGTLSARFDRHQEQHMAEK